MVNVEDDETLDELTKYNMKILQKKKGFRFSVDAVLIANFFKPSKKGVVIDFGTGTGIIPLLISENKRLEKIYALEIQSKIANMAERSVKLNGLEKKIEIINGDIENIEEWFGSDSVDYIISNPPYFAAERGTKNPDNSKMISRHENNISLEKLVYKAKRVLKSCGTISLIYKTERTQEIFSVLEKYNFYVSRVRFVYTTEEKKASLIMVEGVKDRNKGIIVETPMIIQHKSGEYSEEYKSLFSV